MSNIWNDGTGGLSMWRSEWGNMRALQDQIDSQAAAAASTQRRLTSQLSKLQGDLSHRVDRLSTAFDAFVELSQLRDELNLFADARRWRIAAKRLVESSISRGPAPAAGGVESLADVPGYWLAPAVRALPDAIEGGRDGGGLEEASRRDEVRTATFVAAVAPLLGAPSLVAAWLPRAFGEQAVVAITTAQRALWLAAAEGLLPADSVDTVRVVVGARLVLVDAAARERLVADLAGRPPARVASAVVPAASALGVSVQMAAVQSLRQWSALVDTCAAAQPVASGDTAGPSAADGLLSVVRSLVEEGSAEERPLLDRAEQLTAVVDPGGSQPAPPWDGAAGDVGDLLLADSRDAAHPGRARLALDLLRAPLAAAADRLVAQAATEPSTTAELRAGGRTIRVTAAGGDPAEIAAATAPLPPVRRLGPVQLGIGIAVVLFFVFLAVAVATGWIVLAVLALGVVGGWWLVDLSAARRAATENDLAAQRVRDDVAERSRVVAAATVQAGEAAVEAGRLRDALRVRLDALVV